MNKYPAQQGAALLLFILFFVMASSALTLLLGNAIHDDLQTYTRLASSKQNFLAAESGVEDVTYRLMQSLTPATTETLQLSLLRATTTYVHNAGEGRFEVLGENNDKNHFRRSEVYLYIGSGASFNFGVQTGTGGFRMQNGSSVIGNVFSNGTILKTGGGNATIYGDVISAGSGGLIEDITATGTARARVIKNALIGGDAYAYTLDGGVVEGDAYIEEKLGGAVVYGNEYGHQPEEGPSDLPIDEDQIEEMKQDVVDNGTIITSSDPECSTGTWVIEDDITLSHMKIECDVEIRKKGSGTTVTLTNTVWVEGNLSFKSGPEIVIDSSVDNKTVPMIVDNEADRLTSSKITVENGTTFTGSGAARSYVLLLSRNESVAQGGAETAIAFGQSSAGDVLVYASQGLIDLANSVGLKEVTAYRIALGQNAEVKYESGLVNLSFTGGPGGGFTIGRWIEK